MIAEYLFWIISSQEYIYMNLNTKTENKTKKKKQFLDIQTKKKKKIKKNCFQFMLLFFYSFQAPETMKKEKR